MIVSTIPKKSTAQEQLRAHVAFMHDEYMPRVPDFQWSYNLSLAMLAQTRVWTSDCESKFPHSVSSTSSSMSMPVQDGTQTTLVAVTCASP